MEENKNKAVIDVEVILEKLTNIEKMLIEQNMYKKDILSLTEASAYLDLAPSFIYKLTSAFSIPFYKPNGKKIYFERKELDKWLLKNKCLSAEQIEEKIDTMLSSQKHKYK